MNTQHKISQESIRIEEELMGLWDGFPEFINNDYAKKIVGAFFTNNKIVSCDWYEDKFIELLMIFNYAADLEDTLPIKIYDLPDIFELFWGGNYKPPKHYLDMPYEDVKNSYFIHKCPCGITYRYTDKELARQYYIDAKNKAVENGLEELIDAWILGVSAYDLIA